MRCTISCLALILVQVLGCSSDDGGTAGNDPGKGSGGTGSGGVPSGTGASAGSGGTGTGGTSGSAGSVASGWGTESCAASPTALPTGSVFYVSPSGDDANPGTESAPWKTIAKANETLQAGESVVVRAGTYAEVIAPESSGTSASERIRYVAYPGETVELIGTDDGDAVVAIDNRDFISIDGFFLKQANPRNDEAFADIRVRGSGNEILNNTVVNTQSSIESYEADIREIGIQILSGENNLVAGNHVEGLWFAVIIHNPSMKSTVRCNALLSSYMDAVRFESRKGALAGDIIEQNDMGKSAISDGVQFNGDFDLPAEELATDTSSCGVVVRRNRIFDNAENAVDLKGTCHIVVEDNLIYGNHGNNDGSAKINDCTGELDDRCGGVAIMHGTGTSARDDIIRRNVVFDNLGGIFTEATWYAYNNTIVANNRDFTGSNSDFVTDYKPVFSGISGRGVIKNNLIGNHLHSETFLEVNASAIDGNLYFNQLLDEGPRFAIGAAPWSSASFDEWKSALADGDAAGKELASSVGASPFVSVPSAPTADSSALDFRLANGSAPIDHAIPLTTTLGSGTGSEIVVADAGYFYDGFGVTSGDRIVIGDNAPVTITHVDYDADTLTVDASVGWSDGAAVQLEFAGAAGDVGALESE